MTDAKNFLHVKLYALLFPGIVKRLQDSVDAMQIIFTFA